MAAGNTDIFGELLDFWLVFTQDIVNVKEENRPVTLNDVYFVRF